MEQILFGGGYTMEFNLNIKGWAAIIVAVILVGVIGARLMTFNDKKDDQELMSEIEVQLVAEYLPDDAARLEAAYEGGDEAQLEEVADSITSTEMEVKSVQTSYPLFSFTSSKEVVVKVKYSLNDASGTRKEGTKYYLFEHHSAGNSWSYVYESNTVSYYLNFV
jgi:hypothetical protein